MTAEAHRGPGAAFLLTQVGTSAAEGFARAIDELGITPPVAGVLRTISMDSGLSQQALAERLGMLPSRLVALIDDLEERGWVERRRNAHDRRSYALHLTRSGQALQRRIGTVAARHERSVTAPLSDAERRQLTALLARLAEHHGLTPGVHPGYRHVRPKGSR